MLNNLVPQGKSPGNEVACLTNCSEGSNQDITVLMYVTQSERLRSSLMFLIKVFKIHQIFFARAIGLNTSRDAAKTGEYQMIFPK